MTPTSEPALRMASLMHRKCTTPWSEREIKCFRKLVIAHCFKTLEDLELIEKYYSAERRKGDKGMHRRDLYTLIYNWPSELDRARQWEFKQPKSSFQKVKAIMRGEHSELTEEQRQKNLAWIREVAGQLHNKLTVQRDDSLSEARQMT